MPSVRMVAVNFQVALPGGTGPHPLWSENGAGSGLNDETSVRGVADDS